MLNLGLREAVSCLAAWEPEDRGADALNCVAPATARGPRRLTVGEVCGTGAGVGFTTGRDMPLNFPLLATPTPHVNVVL